jgi:hypothetical protein
MIQIRHKNTGQVLSEVDSKNLDGVSFRGAKLAGANFVGQDLRNADFSQADLKGADFSRCMLDGAVFAGAVMRDASFEEASLKRADITDVHAEGASFHKAAMNDVTLRYARLSECDCQGADFTGGDLSMAKMDADFTRAKLCRVDMRGSILSGGMFEEADLSGANIIDARVIGADFNRAKTEGIISSVGQFLGKREFQKKQEKAWWQFWAS